jgi:transposase
MEYLEQHPQWMKAKISIDYHVEYDRVFYFIPYHFYPAEVLIRAAEKTNEIFANGKRLALYLRVQHQGAHCTISDHIPSYHRFYGEWSPQRCIRSAEKIGPETTKIVQIELKSKQYPEQAYRACMGILGFARKNMPGRLESACHYALAYEIQTYRGIKNILMDQLDQLTSTEGLSQPSLPLPHTNSQRKH